MDILSRMLLFYRFNINLIWGKYQYSIYILLVLLISLLFSWYFSFSQKHILIIITILNFNFIIISGFDDSNNVKLLYKIFNLTFLLKAFKLLFFNIVLVIEIATILVLNRLFYTIIPLNELLFIDGFTIIMFYFTNSMMSIFYYLVLFLFVLFPLVNQIDNTILILSFCLLFIVIPAMLYLIKMIIYYDKIY